MNKLPTAPAAQFLLDRAAAKDGYIMCAIGQDPKKLSEWYFSGQYSGAQLAQAYKWRDTAQRVWDCQGLMDGYVSEMTGTSINVRARNNYATWCDPKGTGLIPAEYRMKMAAVFIYSATEGYITHVGYLVEPVVPSNPAGDWYVVEARGVMHGVVKTKLIGRGWNRWGLMTKYFDYGTEQASYELGARELTVGCVGDDVKQMQGTLIDLGFSCGKWGADGEFGAATLAALKEFQTAASLPVTGVYNAATHTALIAGLKDADGAVEINPYPTPTNDVRRGFEGDSVRWVQWELLQWSAECLPKYGLDGDFGQETTNAVKGYQAAHGLVADGIVGDKTRAAMEA